MGLTSAGDSRSRRQPHGTILPNLTKNNLQGVGARNQSRNTWFLSNFHINYLLLNFMTLLHFFLYFLILMDLRPTTAPVSSCHLWAIYILSLIINLCHFLKTALPYTQGKLFILVQDCLKCLCMCVWAHLSVTKAQPCLIEEPLPRSRCHHVVVASPHESRVLVSKFLLLFSLTFTYGNCFLWGGKKVNGFFYTGKKIYIFFGTFPFWKQNNDFETF